MLNTKTKNRILIFLSIFALSIILTIFLLKTLRTNVLYFYSPSEVSKSDENSFKNNIRLGGMVKPGSVETDNNEIKTLVTNDNQNLSTQVEKNTKPSSIEQSILKEIE